MNFSFRDLGFGWAYCPTKPHKWQLLTLSIILSQDQSDETTTSIADADKKQNAKTKITNVQEYILRTMGDRTLEDQDLKPKRKDMITVIIIVVFSILFLYIQKAIYFSK